MAFASRSCALRVRIDGLCLHVFCLVWVVAEVRDKSGSSGGSHTRDVAICTTLFFAGPVSGAGQTGCDEFEG